MEFPRKYKLKDTLVLLVILAAGFGIWYNSYSQKALARRVVIHSVSFEEYDANFIRLGYEIENKGKRDQEVKLLAKVYDAEGEELASLLFAYTAKAQTREHRSKVLDRLVRPLKPDEKPHRATLEILRRKVI